MSSKARIICVILFLCDCTGNAPGLRTADGGLPNDPPSQPGDQNSIIPVPTLPRDCSGLADDTPCSDNDGCTGNDRCAAGKCSGAALAGPCGKTLPMVPLGGSAYALYNLKLTLGSQGPFRLIIDTGSPLMGVTDTTCPNCIMRSPTYSAKPVGGALEQTYGCGVGFQGEGTTGWQANLAQDTVGLAGQQIPLAFASITNGDPTGLDIPMFTCLDNGVANAGQGIIGLQGGTYEGAQGFIDALAKTQQVPDALALQLCDHNGRLWFGGYDPNFIADAPKFTPFVDATRYTVGLNDLTVSGKALGLQRRAFGNEVVVDCGTTRLTFPKAAHDALHAAIVGDANFQTLFGANFLEGAACAQPKQALSQAQLDAALPRLGLVFPGVGSAAAWTLDLPATESYLTPDTTPGAPANSYCPGIEAPGSGFTSNITLIGNTVMHTHITIYDRVNKQMGFAPQAHCDTASAP